MTAKLRVNPIACSGHGLCAELLPELVTLDEWGFPIVADQPVPAAPGQEGQARGDRLPGARVEAFQRVLSATAE